MLLSRVINRVIADSVPSYVIELGSIKKTRCIYGKNTLYSDFYREGVYSKYTTYPLTAWFGQVLLGRQAAFGRLCHFWRWHLRTIVYVDGYNLYYGLLRKSKLKWLDLVALFCDHALDDDADVIEVRYYTAPVLGKMSDNNESPQRQRQYLQALRKMHPTGLTIIEGRIMASTPFQRLVSPIPEAPHLKKVQVYDFNEKKTDVNLASDIIAGAWTDSYDQVVLCSNDSDLEGALATLNKYHPNKRIGIVAPITGDDHRRISKDLSQYATWTKILSPVHLANAQMPDRIPHSKLVKPQTW